MMRDRLLVLLGLVTLVAIQYYWNPGLYLRTANVSPTVNATTEETKEWTRSIAHKRGLSNPEQSGRLLELVYHQEWDYDPKRDFLVYEHQMKTGGTTVSEVLETGLGGVVPGSQKSNFFDGKLYQQAKGDGDDNQAWESYKVLFSHSFVHTTYGNDDEFGVWLRSELPSTRKLKLLVMIRDPVNSIASAMMEWLCKLDGRIKLATKLFPESTRNKTDLCSSFSNLTVLADIWMEHSFKPKCALVREGKTHDEKGQPFGGDQRFCKLSEIMGGKDPKPWCRSVPNLLENEKRYYRLLHDRYERLVPPQTDKEVAAIYEQSALMELGGLATNNQHPISWFGITERMEESMCLLHYTLRVPFQHKTPTHRVKPCRPNRFWSQADKEVVQEREILDYSVYRAANAILDVRMAKMCNEIQTARQRNLQVINLPDSCCNHV